MKKLDTEDLIEVITNEPLLSGEVSIKRYTKEQRKILREKVLEIARLTVDLIELEIIEILMSLL